MTRQRYSAKESLNRILRIFQNKALSSEEAETVTGEVLSEDEALSDLAELLADSLPNEDAIIPPSLVASVAEANEPDAPINTRALTPQSHQWAHEYGGIYVTTGTISQIILTADNWVKITGTFQNEMLNSGEIFGDWNDDRVLVNEIGTYLVMYQASLYSFSNATYLDMEAFVNGVAQPQTSSRTYFSLSGTVGAVRSMVGFAPVAISAIGQAIDLRAKADIDATITIASAQLFATKLVG